MKQNIFKLFALVLVATVILSACRKTGADLTDISFSADKVTVPVGTEVTFSMGYGADALSFFPGDSNHQFSKSATANLGSDPEHVQYIQSHPFVDSFRVDAKAGQPVPSYITAKGTATISSTVDSAFEFTSTSTNGKDTLSIVPAQGGFFPPGVNNIFNQTPDRNVTIVGYFRGAAPSVTQVGIRARFKVNGTWSGTTDTRVTIPTNRDSMFTTVINMTTLVSNWVTANGLANWNKIDEIQLIIGLPLTNPTLGAYQGKYAIKTIRFGEKGYLPWNTGFPVLYTNYQQPATYKYKYSAPGEYVATMVATAVGRKKFAPSGYIENRNPSASEYDLTRQVKQLKITVTP